MRQCAVSSRTTRTTDVSQRPWCVGLLKKDHLIQQHALGPASRPCACGSTTASRENEGYIEHHELAKELLSGLATAEVEKHLENGYYDPLDREQAEWQAR